MSLPPVEAVAADMVSCFTRSAETERQTLMRRALFDPATYGRVRFHHRSVQEYLAARRLKHLRERGMSTRTLFRLLFAERYGVDVVIPSKGNQKAIIEVKLADSRWSLADLERAHRDQVVGQYLRRGSCRAGCLLLTYDGHKKQWSRPEKKRRLTFRQVVSHLNDLARALEIENLHTIRLTVFGLDLTDPVLAHRLPSAKNPRPS